MVLIGNSCLFIKNNLMVHTFQVCKCDYQQQFIPRRATDFLFLGLCYPPT